MQNEDFNLNIGPMGLFSQKYWVLTQKKILRLLMRPAVPSFQSHAARETL